MNSYVAPSWVPSLKTEVKTESPWMPFFPAFFSSLTEEGITFSVFGRGSRKDAVLGSDLRASSRMVLAYRSFSQVAGPAISSGLQALTAWFQTMLGLFVIGRSNHGMSLKDYGTHETAPDSHLTG